MPTGPAKAVKAPRKKAGSAQKQIKHEWAYLVRWYEEIRTYNPSGFGSPQTISFQAILAYRDLFGLEIEPWEAETLLKLDLVWFKTLPKTTKDREK